MIFTHLPVDVTFVDESNDVCFYSGGKNRIFAVRDPQGKFVGTMEVTQDVTAIRKLEGKRKLLDEVQ
jgi:DUF438 domain-containing protein